MGNELAHSITNLMYNMNDSLHRSLRYVVGISSLDIIDLAVRTNETCMITITPAMYYCHTTEHYSKSTADVMARKFISQMPGKCLISCNYCI